MIMKILVDADATPKGVLHICQEVAQRYLVKMLTVASFNHCIEWTDHITVGDGFQETDIKIMGLAKPGDLVVTQDFGLAAMLLAKDVSVITPMGKILRHDTIDFILEEREIKARFRRQGGRTGGPAKRTKGDNKEFREKLIQLMEDIVRQ